MSVPGTCGCSRIDHEPHGLSEHHCRSFAPLQIMCFTKGNEVSVKENAQCHMTLTALYCFQDHNSEFKLVSLLPNSTDVKPTEYISRVIQSSKSFRELKNNNFWISQICMTAALTANTIYICSFTKNVKHPF